VVTKCDENGNVDMADLKAKLEEAKGARFKLIFTDSVFSMDGDLAPLRDLLRVCEQHHALLLVDDAHGFGLLGPDGRGALSHFDLCSPHLIYMGTLGKAAGVGGAFVAAHPDLVAWMVQRARPYIYTTAAPPALAHALQTSLDLIAGEEGHARRSHLRHLIARFAQDTRLNALQRWPSETAIQPVILGSNEAALAASAQLAKQGLWITAIRAPTVPEGTARLRITLSAAHNDAHVERLIAALSPLKTLA